MRSFVRLWVVLSVLVLSYAYVDLRLNPGLASESHFSMRPDFSRIPDLAHWGGRLLTHGAVGLLVGNALVLGGLAALFVRSLTRIGRRFRGERVVERISIVPAPAPTSVRQPSEYSETV